ncbi:MAG: hypothetical protein RJB66_2644 [Pseudomonadota bacterium]|jgi:hypothetical protein
MQLSFLRYLLFVLLIVPISCADGVDLKKHKQRISELEDREDLRATFESLVGIYDGLIVNKRLNEDPYPVILEVFIGEEPDGLNENGELRLRPELRAWFMRTDQGRDNTSSEKYMIGRFYKETSDITFVSQSRSFGGKDAVTISGAVRGDSIIGEASNFRGFMGTFTVKRRRLL